MKHVLVVDDDSIIVGDMCVKVEDAGYEATGVYSVDAAVALIAERDFDCFLLDMHIGTQSGEDVWRAVRKKSAHTPIIFCTGSVGNLRGRIKEDKNTHLIGKPVDGGALARRLRSFWEGLAGLKLFVVHGRNLTALGELEKFLADKLDQPNPIILERFAGFNTTFIEKIEEAAAIADGCIALITPDDINVASARERTKRMRQNVLFELGYFMGKWGRKSGRVIVFVKGDVEMPSDLNGVDFVRVSDRFSDLSDVIVDGIRQRLLHLRER